MSDSDRLTLPTHGERAPRRKSFDELLQRQGLAIDRIGQRLFRQREFLALGRYRHGAQQVQLGIDAFRPTGTEVESGAASGKAITSHRPMCDLRHRDERPETRAVIRIVLFDHDETVLENLVVAAAEGNGALHLAAIQGPLAERSLKHPAAVLGLQGSIVPEGRGRAPHDVDPGLACGETPRTGRDRGE